MADAINVRFRRTSSLAHIPTRGSEKAAGYDLYAAIASSISILDADSLADSLSEVLYSA